MPKRTDIKSILVIGAGPIIIGQGCEFDYSGTQACKALKEEGYRIILVNSNPATIMTDIEFSDQTYIEPITPEFVYKIIQKEKPDAILPTVGGQTALNCVVAMKNLGMLEGVELIGANVESITKAEDRRLFQRVLDKLGLKYPKSSIVSNLEEAKEMLSEISLPAIIRPSYTLGGAGGGIAYNIDEFSQQVRRGLEASPVNEVQIDQAIIGWKEFELEVVRDANDNCIVVCAIENIDPMGVHTGDSITVAPTMTLRDHEYQLMRNAAFAIIREIGVEAGGANVQFALNPDDQEEVLVVEMNPRVSRSSALASKATGFPIAKVAAKLAVGYTLNEIQNDSVQGISAALEPVMDRIVVKIPRFNFEKFPNSNTQLTTSMKSVGESMSIARSFPAALQKAFCSLEIGLNGLNFNDNLDAEQLRARLALPTWDRLLVAAESMRKNIPIKEIKQITKYDPWFLDQIASIIETEQQISACVEPAAKDLLHWKKMGFSDSRIASLRGKTEAEIRSLRKKYQLVPVYKRVDTCAAEFYSATKYMYSSYEGTIDERNNVYRLNSASDESEVSNRNKVIIIGSGPNRIGQGIEFDYACVKAAYFLKGINIESIIINCNPETVSTDYDTADRLYFSALNEEEVLDIIEQEQQKGDLLGVILQLGGQTPLKLAKTLDHYNIKILGTSHESIDIAENRKAFNTLAISLNLLQPQHDTAFGPQEALEKAAAINFPLIIRPSYVLGGQSMAVLYNQSQLTNYLQHHSQVFSSGPLLIDRFLERAIEVDVDAVSNGKEVVILGVMQHIEEAGIHSGDSACRLPDSLEANIKALIIQQTINLALALKVRGLINVQYAIKDNEVYILEVNPRASRTLPFIAKTTGASIIELAIKGMFGQNISANVIPQNLNYVAVKVPVFSFNRFMSSDILLGPEMKSTGEVMGIDSSFPAAYAKAQIASGNDLPLQGSVFISVTDNDKTPAIIEVAKSLADSGFTIYATHGTTKFLTSNSDLTVIPVNKVRQGRPHIVDMMLDGKIDLIINTSAGIQSISDSASIRSTTILKGIPYTTTLAGAKEVAAAIKDIKQNSLEVRCLQEFYSSNSA